MNQPTQEGDAYWRRMPSVPTWCKGAVAGAAVWLVSFSVFYTMEEVSSIIPDWIRELGLVQMFSSACAIIALPIYFGGWFFVWGDNGPPYEWMNSVWTNVAIGITLCALIGAVVARLIGWMVE